MRLRYLTLAGLALIILVPQAQGRLRLRRARIFRRSTNVSQRKRLNVNNLIAAPGTVELDWGGLDSYTTRDFSLPTAIRVSPAGNSLLRGRTEYSLSFDSVESSVGDGSRVLQFSDRLTFAGTTVVYASDHFDVAFAPQVTALLRGDTGVRLGATTIARYDGGGNTIAGIASWSGATAATDSNPAGIWDWGGGYARQLAQAGALSRITPHINLNWERASGFERTLSAFGGIGYQVTGRLTADVSGQRYGLTGGGEDRQFVVSFTYVFGKQK